MPYPGLLHPECLPLQQATADPYRLRRHSNSPGLVSVGSLGPYVHKVCLSPLSISGRCGFDYKCDFAPPTILLGLLLCPWKWCIFLGGIQHSPVDGCSAASCNFGALTGDEHTSFYSTILCGMLSGFRGSSMDENFIPTSRVIQLIGLFSLQQYPSAIPGHVFQLVSPAAQMLSRRLFIDTVQKVVSFSARYVT